MKRYMHMNEANFSGIRANPRFDKTALYRAITSVREDGGLADGWLKSMLTDGKLGAIVSITREYLRSGSHVRWPC